MSVTADQKVYTLPQRNRCRAGRAQVGIPVSQVSVISAATIIKPSLKVQEKVINKVSVLVNTELT